MRLGASLPISSVHDGHGIDAIEPNDDPPLLNGPDKGWALSTRSSTGLDFSSIKQYMSGLFLRNVQ